MTTNTSLIIIVIVVVVSSCLVVVLVTLVLVLSVLVKVSKVKVKVMGIDVSSQARQCHLPRPVSTSALVTGPCLAYPPPALIDPGRLTNPRSSLPP